MFKPLTQRGIDQAKLANRAIGSYPFWRRYSSDLKRCQKTASLVLGLEVHRNGNKNTNDNENIVENDRSYLILDKRLRERAKGVREGRSKHLTYDEAFEVFHLEREADRNLHSEEAPNEGTNKFDKEIPLLETEDEVFVRVQDWIEEVVNDAYEDYLKFGSGSNSGHANGGYDIFAVTHSGTLRIIIEKIVGEQLSGDVKREETDKDGVKVGRLSVPNTSITTIEIFPDDNSSSGQTISMKVKLGDDRNQKVLWKAKLIDLTSTLHLEEKGNDFNYQEL